MTPIRILIVDDHVIVREGLRTLLEEEPTINVVGEAANGVEGVQKAQMLKPQVVLMDLVMPELDGIAATQRIRMSVTDCQVLVLTSFAEDQKVRDAIQAGAIGYLLKDVLKPDLLRAIHAAAHGQPTLHPEAQRHLMRQVTTPDEPSLLHTLTEREMDVLRLIARGLSNREIAATLHLTEGTVKGYVSAILAKLEVNDRTQAALYAVKNKLI
ncbi:MAG: response regulator transcription factor [Chloroflexi bacterium]|nr:response regulator transcription factor [Chloroflexota bacterium]MBP8059298.1 response regulator transcription factor [Chloroflexota bacterium]